MPKSLRIFVMRSGNITDNKSNASALNGSELWIKVSRHVQREIRRKATVMKNIGCFFDDQGDEIVS